MRGIRKKNIIKISEAHNSTIEDVVAEEKRLRILINGSEALKLYCSPVMVRELVAGLIMTEGIIDGGWCAERMSILYNDDIVVDIPAEGRVSLEGSTRTSGCVGGVTFDRESGDRPVPADIRIEKEKLLALFHDFHRRSELYNATGCIHSAALSDGEHLLVVAEDIGRHNAVDKVVGYALIENVPLQDKVILVSGRLSSEMAHKCARWGIPVVVSRAAPTALAIDIAENHGITMIGFMRGRRMNIYTHPERILR